MSGSASRVMNYAENLSREFAYLFNSPIQAPGYEVSFGTMGGWYMEPNDRIPKFRSLLVRAEFEIRIPNLE